MSNNIPSKEEQFQMCKLMANNILLEYLCEEIDDDKLVSRIKNKISKTDYQLGIKIQDPTNGTTINCKLAIKDRDYIVNFDEFFNDDQIQIIIQKTNILPMSLLVVFNNYRDEYYYDLFEDIKSYFFITRNNDESEQEKLDNELDQYGFNFKYDDFARFFLMNNSKKCISQIFELVEEYEEYEESGKVEAVEKYEESEKFEKVVEVVEEYEKSEKSENNLENQNETCKYDNCNNDICKNNNCNDENTISRNQINISGYQNKTCEDETCIVEPKRGGEDFQESENGNEDFQESENGNEDFQESENGNEE